MTASDCEIALATIDDIPGIVELQGLNLLSNGGFLSIEFSNDWFERVLFEMPIIVARRDGRIVGYLVSSPVSVAAGHRSFRQNSEPIQAREIRTITVRSASPRKSETRDLFLECSRRYESD